MTWKDHKRKRKLINLKLKQLYRLFAFIRKQTSFIQVHREANLS